jgi:YggT family protein
MIIPLLLLSVRVLVLAVFTVAAIVACTHWAVKHGHLSPFGALPTTVRRLAQPFLRPFERRLYRGGGNPVNAPYLFFWVALIGGLAVLALIQWAIATAVWFLASASAGPIGLVLFLVNGLFSVLSAAIFIRVLSTWFGFSPYSKPMRVVFVLTDWLIEPLRRVVPPLGMIDITPMVAYFMLVLARWFIVGSLARLAGS